VIGATVEWQPGSPRIWVSALLQEHPQDLQISSEFRGLAEGYIRVRIKVAVANVVMRCRNIVRRGQL
jgi:hypothetical protein